MKKNFLAIAALAVTLCTCIICGCTNSQTNSQREKTNTQQTEQMTEKGNNSRERIDINNGRTLNELNEGIPDIPPDENAPNDNFDGDNNNDNDKKPPCPHHRHPNDRHSFNDFDNDKLREYGAFIPHELLPDRFHHAHKLPAPIPKGSHEKPLPLPELKDEQSNDTASDNN